jgi:hydrogenase maturation protease
MKLLVIGYGNELLGDDAIGPLIARQVAQWSMPDVEVIEAQGLTPELAEPMSRAANVLFADARLGEGGVQMTELAPDLPPSLGHTSDPRWLIGLVQSLWGRRPIGWLISVPAVDFGMGKGLSPRAEEQMAEALLRIFAWTRAVT